MTPFDFDQSENGWRSLDKKRLYLDAAKLIATYVATNEKVILAQDKVSIQTLYFHAGQEYACAGKEYYPRAISFFRKSYKSKEGWDTYVDGTIAFLECSKNKLKQSADKLTMLAENDESLLNNAGLLREFQKSLKVKISYLETYEA